MLSEEHNHQANAGLTVQQIDIEKNKNDNKKILTNVKNFLYKNWCPAENRTREACAGYALRYHSSLLQRDIRFPFQPFPPQGVKRTKLIMRKFYQMSRTFSIKNWCPTENQARDAFEKSIDLYVI